VQQNRGCCGCLAEQLHAHRSTVYRRIHSGDLPAVRIGRKGTSIRIPEGDSTAGLSAIPRRGGGIDPAGGAQVCPAGQRRGSPRRAVQGDPPVACRRCSQHVRGVPQRARLHLGGTRFLELRDGAAAGRRRPGRAPSRGRVPHPLESRVGRRISRPYRPGGDGDLGRTVGQPDRSAGAGIRGVGYRLFSRVDGKPLLGAAAIIGAHSATLVLSTVLPVHLCSQRERKGPQRVCLLTPTASGSNPVPPFTGRPCAPTFPLDPWPA
jgi:excisionase family DNA binding protein